jgi:hypothetical protein
VYPQWIPRRFGIEPADVAGGIVKIHEPMDCADRGKRLINGGVQMRFISALHGDFHERPQERTRAANLT